MGVAQVVDQTNASAIVHGIYADLDATRAAFRSRLQSLGTHTEATVIHVPDRQRQRRERLEVLLAQMLLAVTEVDRLPQLVQFSERSHVEMHRPVGTDGSRLCDVGEQRG